MRSHFKHLEEVEARHRGAMEWLTAKVEEDEEIWRRELIFVSKNFFSPILYFPHFLIQIVIYTCPSP
ncbi:MAG TPA: hypothetical protein VEY68_00480 [Anoxybacillus sp.]|nr:hypothetical protein [Anoxybacillus sp.]